MEISTVSDRKRGNEMNKDYTYSGMVGLTVLNKHTGKQRLMEIDLKKYTKIVSDAAARGFTFENKINAVKFYHDDYTFIYTAVLI